LRAGPRHRFVRGVHGLFVNFVNSMGDYMLSVLLAISVAGQRNERYRHQFPLQEIGMDPLSTFSLDRCHDVEGGAVQSSDVRLFTPNFLVSDFLVSEIPEKPSDVDGLSDDERVVGRLVLSRLPSGQCRERARAYLACRHSASGAGGITQADLCAGPRNQSVFCIQKTAHVCHSLAARSPPDFMQGPIAGVAPVRKGPWRIAHLGMGEGSLGTFITNQFPQAEVDAVDLDPLMIEAAKHLFGNVERPMYRQHQADAIAWLQKQPSTFDAIHMGCSKLTEQDGLVHLVDGGGFYTPTFFKLVRDRLREGGRFSVMTGIAQDQGIEAVSNLLLGANFSKLVLGNGPRGTTMVGFTDEMTPTLFMADTADNRSTPLLQLFPEWSWKFY